MCSVCLCVGAFCCLKNDTTDMSGLIAVVRYGNGGQGGILGSFSHIFLSSSIFFLFHNHQL